MVSLQKTVRDRQQEIPVTNIYYGIAWFAVLCSLTLMVVGLWNATFTLSEKGFYGMAFTLSLFAAVTVKNARDTNAIAELEGDSSATTPRRSWFKTGSAWGETEDEEDTPNNVCQPSFRRGSSVNARASPSCSIKVF